MIIYFRVVVKYFMHSFLEDRVIERVEIHVVTSFARDSLAKGGTKTIGPGGEEAHKILIMPHKFQKAAYLLIYGTGPFCALICSLCTTLSFRHFWPLSKDRNLVRILAKICIKMGKL